MQRVIISLHLLNYNYTIIILPYSKLELCSTTTTVKAQTILIVCTKTKQEYSNYLLCLCYQLQAAIEFRKIQQKRLAAYLIHVNGKLVKLVLQTWNSLFYTLKMSIQCLFTIITLACGENAVERRNHSMLDIS